MKKFNLNEKNFYVKKLGAVKFWNKNEEFRFKKNFLHCSILSKRIYGIGLRYLIHKFMFNT